MSGLGFDCSTGLPYELPGADIPKPGRDQAQGVPPELQGQKPKSDGFQSPPADVAAENAARLVGILDV